MRTSWPMPVATVSIGGARNAGILAARILATSDPQLYVQLEADRASLYGCSDYFDNLSVCLEEESECESNDIFTAEDRCSDEQREYGSCMSDGGFGFPI